MMDPQLSKALLPVAARYRHRRLVLLLTSSWLLLGILLAVIYFRPPSWVLPPLGLVSAAGFIQAPAHQDKVPELRLYPSGRVPG